MKRIAHILIIVFTSQLLKCFIVFLGGQMGGAAWQNKAYSQEPVMSWDFENIRNRLLTEKHTNISDTIEGNFEIVRGIKGKGLRFDGFTTRILRNSENVVELGTDFTIDAWLALGEYPLNWCPVITAESANSEGYRLMIGPYGQASFQISIEGQWMTCASAEKSVPLRTWVNIAAVYREGSKLTLFINGDPVSETMINGSASLADNASCIIGMVAEPERPANTIRRWGTVPTHYGLDGIIDEIRVFDQAFSGEELKGEYAKYEIQIPQIDKRKLPLVKSDPGRFGAYYTKLKYYPEWDTLWPVDQDPDIVVCFENSPVKLIFWRGIRYGPSWVSENQNWMTDQSLETWGVGEKDIEGCFEHMQDRHCRFSHVRIIENNEARAVVHWRYAPVSAHDHTWLPDPKTGWECWVDEYYYIYPDGSAIRKVSWNKGTTGRALQLQESLPLTQPGQEMNDVIENEYVTIADYDFNINTVAVDPPVKPPGWNGNYTVQQYNFKSENKPFILFEPGNHMWIRWIGGGYNHFPVNQARSDGRWAKTNDRPSHFMSSPCSDPVIHENGNRLYWSALYGMNQMNIQELISFGRSWAYAPEIDLANEITVSLDYDRSERCYKIENNENFEPIEIKLNGSSKTPVINPAFVIHNWNSDSANVLINGKNLEKTRIGFNYNLNGADLIIFIPIKEIKPVNITILP